MTITSATPASSPPWVPHLNEQFAFGAPMCTPSLGEMMDIWRQVTGAADPFLDALTTEKLEEIWLRDGQGGSQSIGSAPRRIPYHYWYHSGEIQAMRQMIGHTDLPVYVGDIEGEAPYRRE